MNRPSMVAKLISSAVLGFSVIWVVMCLASRTPQSRPQSIMWLSEMKSASREAAMRRKILMVDVVMNGCYWCHEMDTEVYTQPDVIAAAGVFVPVKLHLETNGLKIARRYNVDTYPTVLFLNPDGAEISRIVGYEGDGQFVPDLHEIESLGTKGRDSGTPNLVSVAMPKE